MRDVCDCKTMEDLFACWKEAQKNVSNPNCENRHICKESFAPDGIICEKKYCQEIKRILIISKECNLTPPAENAMVCADGVHFWLKDILLSGVNHAETGSGTRYINGLAVICNAILNVNNTTPDKDWTNLKKCAYINLNKRGGYSSCKDEYLTEYVEQERFKFFIKRQIELINPTIIVCCGEIVHELVRPIIDNSIELWCAYHPSCRRSYQIIYDSLSKV